MKSFKVPFEIGQEEAELTVSGNTFTRRETGIYTPNNDAPVQVTFDQSAPYPTWLLFNCDKMTNLYMNMSSGIPAIQGLGVNKIFVIAGMDSSGGIPTNIIFNGLVGSYPQMSQGQAVHWSVFYGDGTLS